MNTLSAVAVLIFANTLLLGQAGQTPPTPQSRTQLSGVPASSSALSSGLPVPAPAPPVSPSSTPAAGVAGNGSAPVYGFNLTYADNGNIVQAQDSVNGTWNYTYDDFNRLLTATTLTGSGPGQSFNYDAYGNRWQENVTQGQAQSTQFVFDNSNRIIGSGVKYDTLGNVIADGFHKYTYDAENRLVKVDARPDGTAAAVTYTYDAFGRRLSKTAPGGATEFLYDLAGRVIAEKDTATGAWNRSEVYVGGRHLATYARDTTYFRHSDWLGSSRVKTLPDGTVAETCTNLPFGDGLSCTPGAGQFASPDLFAGYERDQETQLDHTMFRKYSSAQGRWTTPDPYLGSMDLANPQSLNRYAYVLNNPVNLRDPLGLEFQCLVDDGNGKTVADTDIDNEGDCDAAGGIWSWSYVSGEITVTAKDPGPSDELPWWVAGSGWDPWLEGAADFFSGMGSALTFGGTDLINKATGGSQSVNPCSGWHTAGTVAGIAVSTAIGASAGSQALPSALKGLSNGTKGAIGEGLSIAENTLAGSTRVGTQMKATELGLNLTTRFDSVWQSASRGTYYVEAKFGTSGLTSAQRVAANFLGDAYQVERWTYPFFGRVGGYVGAGAGAAGSMSGGSGCN